MKNNSVTGMPLGPLDWYFSCGAIPGTWYITEDLIKLEFVLDIVNFVEIEFWQELSRMVDNSYSCSS